MQAGVTRNTFVRGWLPVDADEPTWDLQPL